MKRERKQSLLPFEYEPEPDGDEVTAWSGLPIVVEVMKQLKLDEAAKALKLRQRDAGHDESQLLTAFVLLLVAGGDCLDDVRMLRYNKALCALLGHGLPSPDVLRRTLEMFHDEKAVAARPSEGAWIAPENERLAALGLLHKKLAADIAHNTPDLAKTVTIDLDATVIESRKREAMAHYKGGRGYQPVVALWAEAGVVLADEFRDGNVPAGMGRATLLESRSAS